MGYSLKRQKRNYNYKCFQEILNGSKRKSNKIWVDKSREFYSRLINSFLQNNGLETYSMHNEGKSVIA